MRKKSLIITLLLLPAALMTFMTASQLQAQTCTNTPTSSNTVTATVTLSESASYTIWSRLITKDALNNSFWLQIDGGCAINIGDNATIPSNQLTWVNYQDGNTALPVAVNLTAGIHTIKITQRETGVGIDKLLFTTNSTCIPSATGTNCPVATSTPMISPPTPLPTAIAPTPTIFVPPTSTPSPAALPTPTNTPIPTQTPTPLSQTYTLYPIADAHVNSNAKSSNYGTRTAMTVDSSPTNIAYLKFDLTPFAGKTIVSAQFRIRTASETSRDQQRIKQVSNTTWSETTLTHNNRPAISNTVVATLDSKNAPNAWQQVLLTQTVAANTGKVLGLAIDSGGSNDIHYMSKESISKPELVIQIQ